MIKFHIKNTSVAAVVIFIAIIHNYCITYCNGTFEMHYQSLKNEIPKSELPQDRMDTLTLPKNQTLLVRLPSSSLLKYTSYKDVSILHFRIPPDTRTAFFTFKAYEESKGAFQRKCHPRDVSLHLKASSYPVISPENITFPKNFLLDKQRFKMYDLQFESNETEQHVVVEGPYVGNWFAVAFVSWTDPNNERIEQQGIAASCDTLLLAELSVSRFHPNIINRDQVMNGTLKSCTGPSQDMGQKSLKKIKENSVEFLRAFATLQPLKAKRDAEPDHAAAREEIEVNANNSHISTGISENNFKFFVPEDIGTATIRVVVLEDCPHCPSVEFMVQANAFPHISATPEINNDNFIYHTTIDMNQTGENETHEIPVQANTWHYILLRFVGSNKNAPISPSENNKSEDNNCNHWHYSLLIEFKNTDIANTSSSSASRGRTTKTRGTPENLSGGNVNAGQPVRFRGIEFYPLLRQTYREFFMFDYDLMPDANGTVAPVLNLTAGVPIGFSFDIGDVYDIGGTLTFALSMKGNLKSSNEIKSAQTAHSVQPERSGILAEKLIGLPRASENNVSRGIGAPKVLPRSNQTIIICIHLGEPGEPSWPDRCRYGDQLLPAASIVNNTDASTSTGIVHVPFPESGRWYITMGLFCHGAETAARVTIIDSVKEFIRHHGNMIRAMRPPCVCTAEAARYERCINDPQCLAAMNETETLKIKECLMDSKCSDNYSEMTRKFEIHHKLATEQHLALDNCNSSVMFTISSSPCVAGRCGRFGRCYHYMSGGFVFSTCVCMKGYRGWDCTEDSQVPDSLSILIASLLLTLSNLLFFPSIYMAARRKYYTEAVIYFFAMFFSIFYHACDSGEDEYSFCLTKIGVLQFSDFYCGLLAIWVTLVAMSHVRLQFVSLLHMFGAILLAFGTEWNKQSLWIFLAPTLTGICIISVSWGMRCHKSRKMFPAKKYLTVYMPLGAVLVMVGLVCYAFLQTKQNYYIVHSVWHMVMALSILCLLPSRNSFVPKC